MEVEMGRGKREVVMLFSFDLMRLGLYTPPLESVYMYSPGVLATRNTNTFSVSIRAKLTFPTTTTPLCLIGICDPTLTVKGFIYIYTCMCVCVCANTHTVRIGQHRGDSRHMFLR